MKLKCLRVATSNLFRFLVGPDKQEFTIHSALVAHQSPVLKALVYGRFKEAMDCSVEWDEIDERTFISFWQYVYTGEYDTPEPLPTITSNTVASSNHDHLEADELDAQLFENTPSEELEPAPAPAPAPAPEPEPEPEPEILPMEPPPVPEPEIMHMEPAPAMDDDRAHPQKHKKKKRAKREMLWDDFQESGRLDLSVCVTDGTREIEKRPADHADIFVHHARVYILGDRYGITRLMDLAFHKLHQTLVGYEAFDKELNDVVVLLRYCYAELVPERLRQLVIHYASCKVEELWKSEDFQELLEEYGSLSRALVGSMLLRLD